MGESRVLGRISDGYSHVPHGDIAAARDLGPSIEYLASLTLTRPARDEATTVGKRHLLNVFLAAGLLSTTASTPAIAAELGMGLRVGEVKQESAIVWTRVTETAERNWDGFRDPKKREPRVQEFTPPTVKVADRDGNMAGAAGEVRLLYGNGKSLSDAKTTPWVAVEAKNDFIHKFILRDLQAGRKYYIRVEARDSEDAPISATTDGSFGTPAKADDWQDVSFGVVTGQSYWDLDDRRGYHCYPAMAKLKLDFLVLTGDTVYLDSESPRARTVELARYHWRRMYTLPRIIDFHRHTPGYWEVDDHDTYVNDGWPTINAKWMQPLTYKQGAKIFREQNPAPEVTYRTIRWGQGLQVWLVEGRDYRSPNTMADGPRKSIWGKEQMAWLKRTVLASDAKFRVLISPTPIVGPDRSNKRDNHANEAFAHEGNHFRQWTADNKLDNFFVCCGDRHWQYYSIDPKTKLREFSCGPVSNKHAGGSPGHDPKIQPFHRQKGGVLTVHVTRRDDVSKISFHHRDVHGAIVHTIEATTEKLR